MYAHLFDPSLLRTLSISYLLTTYAQGFHAYPQTNPKNPNANSSFALANSSSNLLPSRFSSLSLSFGNLSPDRFTVADIALAFINALAEQTLEPFDARLSYFEHTDAQVPVRIVLRSAPYAPTALTVRSNVMWALKQLPIDLFHDPSIWGLDFKVLLSGEDLYLGKLSNSNRPGGVLQRGGARGGNGGLESSEQERKRARWFTRSVNTTATTGHLTVPDQSANSRYDLRFQFAGAPLSDIGIFSTILEFLFALGAKDPSRAVEAISFSRDTLPVWIFAQYNAGSGSARGLHVYEVAALLRAIAGYCVELRIYQELSFNLVIDDVLTATGCVVRGIEERKWCRGLEGGFNGDGSGLVGLDLNQTVSLTA